MATNNPSYVKVNRGAMPTWEDFNALVDIVSRQKLKQGVGYLISEKPGGTTLNINVPPTPSVNPTPFQVTTRPDPNNPGQFQAMVNLQSDLLISSQPNKNLTVTGLNTWFPFIANDLISLYIVISKYVVQSATIQSYGMGTTTFDPTLAAWSSGDNSYVFNDGATPPFQIGANIMLAYSTPDALGNPYLVQAQFDHILLENCSIDGYPAIYDFSHRRRYGITAPTPPT
jgi:hypothetical protein